MASNEGRRARRGQRGFTLIEIMTVVIIVAILAAVAVPQFIGADDEARYKMEKVSMQSIGNALENYRLHNRHYPSTEQGIDALMSPPAGFPEPKNWRGPYLRQRPIDQWGNEYVYVREGRSYQLTSLGADGEEGGEDEYEADINHPELLH